MDSGDVSRQVQRMVARSFTALFLMIMGGILFLFGIPAAILWHRLQDEPPDPVQQGAFCLTVGGGIGLVGSIVGFALWYKFAKERSALGKHLGLASPPRRLQWAELAPDPARTGLVPIRAIGGCALCRREATHTKRVVEKAGALAALEGVGGVSEGVIAVAEEKRKLGVPRRVLGIEFAYPVCDACRPKLARPVLFAVGNLAFVMIFLAFVSGGAAAAVVGLGMLIFGGLAIGVAAIVAIAAIHPVAISFLPGRVLLRYPTHLTLDTLARPPVAHPPPPPRA